MRKYDLYLTGTVGGWGIQPDYVKYILDKKKDQPVDVAICSRGGYVAAGLEIYELIKNHGQVTCHFIGVSASAATFMAMGAKKVVMSKNALILIHNAMSAVLEWGNYNKEQIDEIVKNLQFQRKQLNTIDDVLAEIYAEKSGKSVDEVKEKMKVAAWIKAAEAKGFGLVDEIAAAEKVPADISNTYSNNIFKDMGLPALPRGFNQETGEENPTAGVLNKVIELLRGLMPVTSTTNSLNEMKITVFASLATALGVKDGFDADEQGNVSLSQNQLKTIDDKLKEQNDACTQAAETLKAQKTKIETLENEKKTLEDKVKNLSGSAPTEEPENVDGGYENHLSGAAELWNSIKDAL